MIYSKIYSKNKPGFLLATAPIMFLLCIINIFLAITIQRHLLLPVAKRQEKLYFSCRRKFFLALIAQQKNNGSLVRKTKSGWIIQTDTTTYQWEEKGNVLYYRWYGEHKRPVITQHKFLPVCERFSW